MGKKRVRDWPKRPDARANATPSRTYVETGAQSGRAKAIFIGVERPDKRSAWYRELKRRTAAALAPYGAGVDPLVASAVRSLVYSELILERAYAKIGRTDSVTSAAGDGPSGATMSALAAVREVRGMLAQIRDHLDSIGGSAGVTPELIQIQREAAREHMRELTAEARAAVRWFQFRRDQPPPVPAQPLLLRRLKPVIERRSAPLPDGDEQAAQVGDDPARADLSASRDPQPDRPEESNPKQKPQQGGFGCRVVRPEPPSPEKYQEMVDEMKSWGGNSPW